MDIVSYDWNELSDEQLLVYCEIWNDIWRKDADATAQRERLKKVIHPLAHPDHLLHELSIAGKVQALARTFTRTIKLDEESVCIVALASVCSHPDARGKGYGAAIVEHAFKHVSDRHRCVFFQTGVPGFYEKLGARVVTNSITSSLPDARLFWEPAVMVWPADTAWNDTATIDLMGSGW